MIRLLFSDVDRTLLTHGYELLPAVSRAVEEAQAANIQVVLATARSPMAVRRYAQAMKLTGTCICLNGAWIGDVTTGVGSVFGAISHPEAQRMVELISNAGSDVLIYTANAIYTFRLTPAVATHCTRTGDVATEIDSLSTVAEPILKLLCLGTPTADGVTFTTLCELLGPSVDAAQSRVDLLEITDKAVSKGRAAEVVANRLGVQPGLWAAIGDSDNDVPLLMGASLRMTVDNATEAVKKVATHHFSSCDAAGFAEAVSHLIHRNAAEAAVGNSQATTR